MQLSKASDLKRTAFRRTQTVLQAYRESKGKHRQEYLAVSVAYLKERRSKGRVGAILLAKEQRRNTERPCLCLIKL